MRKYGDGSVYRRKDGRWVAQVWWIVAAELSLPLEPGRFKQTYKANRGRATAMALEASPVGEALLAFMEERHEWEGIAKELKQQLEAFLSSNNDYEKVNTKGWPHFAKGMADALRRIAPDLRMLGIEVTFLERETSRRPIRIMKRGADDPE
jgi:hypothetical protein